MGSTVNPVFEVVPPKNQFEVVPPRSTGFMGQLEEAAKTANYGAGEFANPEHPAHAMAKQALEDIKQGNYAKGAHGLIGAGMEFLRPTLPATIAAAPMTSAIGFAGGAAGSKIGQVGAAALGATAEQAAVAGDIAGIAAGAGVGKAANVLGSAASELAPKLYKSALKPSTTIPDWKIQNIIKTGLAEDVPVSHEGLEKLGGMIDDINQEIHDKIEAATKPGGKTTPEEEAMFQKTFGKEHKEVQDLAEWETGSREGAFPPPPGVTVNKYAVASRLGGTAQEFGAQVTPAKDLATVARTGNEFLREQPNEIPALTAQEMKQGTYQQIQKSYGRLSSASIESQKALARGIKEELAAQIPEIGELNARESKLIDLDTTLERAVNRIGNHQIIGIGTPILAGGARAITGSTPVAAIAGIIKAVVDNPIVKSRLAIALAKRGVPLNAAADRISAYSAALAGASAAAPPAGQPNTQGGGQ
jgi:hypothetical protein